MPTEPPIPDCLELVFMESPHPPANIGQQWDRSRQSTNGMHRDLKRSVAIPQY
jgi:hypothetical protein